MIEKMTKYTFLVFHGDYEAFLTSIREAGVVHINEKAEGYAENENLQQVLAKANNLERILRQGASDELVQQRTELEAQLATVKAEIQRMSVWGNFDTKKLQLMRENGYDLHFYICPTAQYNEEWGGVVVGEAGGKVYFVEVRPLTLQDRCAEGSQTASAEGLVITADEVKLNEHNVAQLEADKVAIEKQLEANAKAVEAWQGRERQGVEDELKSVQRTIDWDKVELATNNLADDTLKLVEGFCPDTNKAELEAVLAATEGVYYEAAAPTKEDNTPIKLKNNWFTKLFEVLTGMYGWPNYHEFDPTPILGPFFLLFFALCIGDAGYGLILILCGYLIFKGKLKIEMFEGLGPIIMALGVGSTVIGYLMGGFFGMDIWAANWVPEALKVPMFKSWIGEGGVVPVAAMNQSFDVMMVLALVIGVLHLCLAMTIKCICYTQRFGFKEAVSAWGWLILIVGGISVFILSSLGIFGPQVTSILLIIIACVSALGIFIFNTPGRNPLINIGAGLWDTYGMTTGILGDVLSYIRLYALGLAGGMLGQAFNNLGTMVLGENPNVGTVIGFVLIVTFGHVLNLLMSCLGAFVHPLRLSFVEYFKNAGYEGSGKVYRPFHI
ncbi:MAG: ATPase V [Paludibacteraceae bacterium]|nr:ATPase V [Paludibacteraceae bacterium]